MFSASLEEKGAKDSKFMALIFWAFNGLSFAEGRPVRTALRASGSTVCLVRRKLAALQAESGAEACHAYDMPSYD
jgi:hypothetical protein